MSADLVQENRELWVRAVAAEGIIAQIQSCAWSMTQHCINRQADPGLSSEERYRLEVRAGAYAYPLTWHPSYLGLDAPAPAAHPADCEGCTVCMPLGRDEQAAAAPDCNICGEEHADRDCPEKFCAVCWDLVGNDGTCECPNEPTPATAAEWIDEGRPEKRKPVKVLECDHGRTSCRQCAAEEHAESERDDRAGV